MKRKDDNEKILSTNEFPVVGIGASAGGLDAFKRLIKAIPEDSGMAYVLVQHLAPTHNSLLPELLQKVTKIPVLEISDDIKVLPNHIYIIPSNKLLVANDGVLQLSPRPDKSKTERNLSIDLFFTSLAEVHQSHAIGVVLSGTATDGTKGLKAIKDYGGITFAQDEDSAAYEGMPHSAAEAGVVDFILPPEKIAEKLIEIQNNIYKKPIAGENIQPQDEDIFKQILSLLRIRKGNDFTYYKQTTIRRRILRRMALNKNKEPAAYLTYLRENKAEQSILYQDLLIPVTAFFRDQTVFDTLCESVFPHVLKNKSAGEPIRVWVAACSTGEEAYSIAMCLKEYLNHDQRQVQIFATDISEPAIVKARSGMYTKRDVDGMSPQRLQEFFTKTNGSYQVNRGLRDMCVFACHNFLKDPPFGKIDFVSCRNVLIYLEPYLQKKALTTFHYSLNPKGYLLLGKSETSSSMPDLFVSAGKLDKLFTRKDRPGSFIHVASLSREKKLHELNTNPKTEALSTDFQKTADEIMLSKYTPAGVVVNEAMDVVHFRGSTGNYLEQAPGKPSHNLLKMAKGGLAFELRNILHKAKKQNTALLKEGIPMQVNGIPRMVTIEAVPLHNIVEPHYLILFHDHPLPVNAKKETGTAAAKLKKDEKDQHIQQLEKELIHVREDMRSITEDQETANEELQSANEELLSGSEELQSLNEELETSKEEMQSTNEELVIVNQELISLNEQITAARHYAESIVDTIREPLLVLDKNLRIKTANKAFYKTFRLQEAKTIGDLIYNLDNRQWDIPLLRTLLEEILPEKRNLTDFEVHHHFSDFGERILLMNACEMAPKKTDERLILLAIEDITERKQYQRKETELLNRFKSLVKQAPVAICILQGKEYIVELANDFYLQLVDKRKDFIGTPLFESLPEFKTQGIRELLDNVQETGKPFFVNEISLHIERNKKMEQGFYNFVYQPICEPDKTVSGIIVLVTDVTHKLIARKKMEAQALMVQDLLMSAPGFICTLSGPDHVYELVNDRYQQLFGKRIIQGKPLLEALPELVGQGFDTLLDEVYTTGVPYMGIDVPITLAHDENSPPELRYFNFSYQPMYDENKKIYSILVFGYEVTEQMNAQMEILRIEKQHAKELEEKVQQRTIQLSEANESLQQKNQEIALSKYNKRFLIEFSEKFSAYKMHTEFFNSLVQFISDTTHLDHVFVGKLVQNEVNEFGIQTIALSSFGKIVENINYPLNNGPCEQVIRGEIYSYVKGCRQTFPENKTIAQFKVEGYLGYPLNDQNGEVIGLISVMHEREIEDAETILSVLKIVAGRAEIEMERITQEEQLVLHNTILKEKNESLKQMNLELESFTFISSHDLQEPLRKIQTFATRVLETEYAVLSVKGQDYFNRMHNAAKRMQNLIEDLLAYSHTSITKRRFEKTDLTLIIEEVKLQLEESILEKQAVIEYGPLCEAYINHFQFRQVINNLISNSLKFSVAERVPHISITTKISLGVDLHSENNTLGPLGLLPETHYCHIVFTDNGIGFDPQYGNKIFEVFQRLHSKEEYAGTGIGLAIVKKIIENHSGFIIATGEINKGVKFDMFIPTP